MKRFLVLWVMICAHMLKSAAQSFEHYYTFSGLSQSTILSIGKDGSGFMWFGTRDGLNRFDGHSFKVYQYQPQDPYSISSSDYIYALFTDSRGDLWIGTRNGLNRYLPGKDGFERLTSSSQPGSLSDNNVFCICQDHAGRIWVGTNNGLDMLESPDGRFFHRFPNFSNNHIYAIYEDANHQLWIGTTRGLVRMWQQDGRWRTRIYVHQRNDPQSLADNSVKAITGDKNGNIWVGTEDGGMDRLSVASGTFTHYAHSSDPNSISSDNVRKIITGKDGRLWIATIDGLNIFDTTTKRFTVIRHSQDNGQSLSDNSIKDIYQDDAGSLWIGTMYGGVNVLHSGAVPFTVYAHNPFTLNTVSANIISAILPDNNNLWIGTEGQGLNFYNRSVNQFVHYKHDPGNGQSLSSDFIKALVKGKDGGIWIGAYLGGVDLYNPQNKTFTHFRHIIGNPNTLSSDNVTSLFIDASGKLWAGTADGLNIFDTSVNNFRKIHAGELADNDLCSPSIRTIFEDSRHNLWIGTVNGINFLKPGSRHWQDFLQTKDIASGAISGYIDCIFEDRENQIWVGSYRGGLNLYLPGKQSFKNISEKDGLVSNNILSIQQGNNDRLWISTDKGLTYYDPRAHSIKNFDVSDGLPSNEFNYNSSAKDNDGNLYFGSYGGLVSFLPDAISQNKVPPKMVLTDIKIFNKSVLDSNNRFHIANIASLDKIDFRYNQNVFTINFAALNYIHPQRNRYAYKLKGFEKEWNYTSEPAATYMNLPAGSYTLLIKGANNDGVWSRVYALKINVLPPWWRTWWAYSLYVLLASLAFIYTIRFFKRQAALERDLYHEQLHSKKTEELYQLKLDFFTKVSHEIRTPLTLIIAPLDKLMDSLYNSPLITGQLSRIRNNAQRLLRLVNELLDYRKLDAGVIRLDTHTVNLVTFCKSICDSFLDVARSRKIAYQFCPASAMAVVAIDGLQFEKVLYNLIFNAFKYTPDGGRIQITLEQSDMEQIVLHVADNGVGIPVEKQSRIFEEFYQADNQNIQSKGWGIGLALAKKIMLLHQGDVWIAPDPKLIFPWANTCFSLCLPAGEESAGGHEPDTAPAKAPEENSEEMPVAAIFDNNGSEKDPKDKPVILIIEDEAEVRAFMRESLEHAYLVLEAEAGNRGLDIAVKQIPDLIISDVNMPGMDGLELCRKLKTDERTSHIPIILLTAQAAYTQQVVGLQEGADLYLTKPFSLQILELSIRNLLSLSAAMRKKYSSQYHLMPVNKTLESVDEMFLSRLMEIIEENMDAPDFKVTDLARKIGMSQTVLYKKIKALTDLSITDFIKSIRLKRSAQLLQSPVKMTIAEIAYMVGFSDPKYFTREFRKQYGQSPSEYAAVHKKELSGTP